MPKLNEKPKYHTIRTVPKSILKIVKPE